MSRPLRLEYPGALYHVTSRGNAQSAIYADDEDRDKFISLLKDEVIQQGWHCYAWCLMGNHYHFLIETPEANLSRGMQRLNGRYTQCFNRRHERCGHVFQGRYKAILVEKESHLLELCRYIVLNPVRAGMVEDVSHWQWSSYHDTLSGASESRWLARDHVLQLFSEERELAINRYRAFVTQVEDLKSPWGQLRGQIYLGSEDFLAKSRLMIANKQVDLDIPSSQSHPERATSDQVLNDVAEAYGIEIGQVLDRHHHREAYLAGVYLLRRICNMSLKNVAALAGVSIGRVSQIQKKIADEGLIPALNKYKV